MKREFAGVYRPVRLVAGVLPQRRRRWHGDCTCVFRLYRMMNACNESVLIQSENSRESANLIAAGFGGRRIRIWLVDDSKNLRELLAGLLAAEEGFDCSRQFPSAEAVLEALSIETPPDVILLDNRMGGMLGVEALRPIKRLAGATRVLMLTSCCDPETKARAFRNGASDFLSKSCDVSEIAGRIRQAQLSPTTHCVPHDSQGNILGGRLGRITRGGDGTELEFNRVGCAIRIEDKRFDPDAARPGNKKRLKARWQGASARFWCGINRLRAALQRARAGST